MTFEERQALYTAEWELERAWEAERAASQPVVDEYGEVSTVSQQQAIAKAAAEARSTDTDVGPIADTDTGEMKEEGGLSPSVLDEIAEAWENIVSGDDDDDTGSGEIGEVDIDRLVEKIGDVPLVDVNDYDSSESTWEGFYTSLVDIAEVIDEIGSLSEEDWVIGVDRTEGVMYLWRTEHNR